jgi:hypothetical protein
MSDLDLKLAELEKKVAKAKKKPKKIVSKELISEFKKILLKTDELNKEVLNYNGTNIYLYAKMYVSDAMTDYAQY